MALHISVALLAALQTGSLPDCSLFRLPLLKLHVFLPLLSSQAESL